MKEKEYTRESSWRSSTKTRRQVAEEHILEVPLAWNGVPDLMLKDKEGLMITETGTKRKRDEVAWGRRKRQKEDHICPEKSEHSPTVSRSTQNPAGFYSEDWDECQQEEDDFRCQLNGRGFHRWCFVVDVWRKILMRPDIYQVSVLNTKEADVAYLQCIEINPIVRRRRVF